MVKHPLNSISCIWSTPYGPGLWAGHRAPAGCPRNHENGFRSASVLDGESDYHIHIISQCKTWDSNPRLPVKVFQDRSYFLHQVLRLTHSQGLHYGRYAGIPKPHTCLLQCYALRPRFTSKCLLKVPTWMPCYWVKYTWNQPHILTTHIPCSPTSQSRIQLALSFFPHLCYHL